MWRPRWELAQPLTTALCSLTPGASTSFPLFPLLLVHGGHRWDTPLDTPLDTPPGHASRTRPGHASRTRRPDTPPGPATQPQPPGRISNGSSSAHRV